MSIASCKSARAAACVLLFALESVAQVGLSGVTGGLVYDPPTRSLRPVRGVSGAAYLGPAIVSDADDAFVSPDGQMALLRRGNRFQLHRFASTNLVNEQLLQPEVAPGETCRASWAREKVSVILTCSGANTSAVHLIALGAAGESWSARVQGDVVFASKAAGNGPVVIGFNDSSTSGVFTLTADGIQRPLFAARGILSGCLDDKGNSAYVIESETGTLFRVPVDGGNMESILSVEPGSLTGLVVADNAALIAGVGATASVQVVDLGRRAVIANVPLDSRPEMMASAGRRGLWVLNLRGEANSGAATLFDLVNASSFFVPAGPGDSQ